MIQLHFSAPADSWAKLLCEQKRATVKLLSLRSQDSAVGSVAHFVDVSSEVASAEDLTKELKDSRDVIDCDLVRVGTNRIIGSVTSKKCIVCKALVELSTGAFIGPAITENDCTLGYKLFISGGGLPLFLQRLHKDQIVYKILDISSLSSGKGLTSRQQEVLKVALELGYYDFPKRISTEKLAAKAGIKPGTLTEILRRAEKKVISRYFETGAEG